MLIPKQKLIMLLVVGLLTACSDYKIDGSVKSDFDLLFTYLNNDYAYRNDFDLDSIKNKYLPIIEQSPDTKTLAKIVVDIEHIDLKDPHVYFVGDSDPYQLIGSDIYENPNLEYKNPMFKDAQIDFIGGNHFYRYGVAKNDNKIGYIYIMAFNYDTGGDNALGIAKGISDIEDFIDKLKKLGVEKMIVDIRSDAGGSGFVPKYIAARFVDKEAIYMIEHYPVGKGFKQREWTIKPEGDIQFTTGKVALLTNGNTCSGGEMFVLAMLQRTNVVHIGSNTKGCSGNVVDKDLANGWNVRITNSRTTKPDGTAYFKVGLTPHIIVKNSDNYPTNNTQDKVIAKAIDTLRN